MQWLCKGGKQFGSSCKEAAVVVIVGMGWMPLSFITNGCHLASSFSLSLPKVLALRRGGATSGYWLHGWDPLWLQRYRWAWRDLNLVLALPTRLFSLVLRLLPVGILGCDQGKQYNHRRHRGTGGRTLSRGSKDSWRRKGYIFPSYPKYWCNQIF